MLVIGLSGWAKSGKDMVSEYLCGKGFSRLAFADPLKEDVMKNCKLSHSDVYDQDFKEKPLLNRPLKPEDKFSEAIANILWNECRFEDGSRPKQPPHLVANGFLAIHPQTFGLQSLYWTPRALCILHGSLQRSWNVNYWVDKALASVKFGQKYVIADLRYKSEIKACIDNMGGHFVPVRVKRFETTLSVDPSERDLDDYPFQYQIKNTGTKEEAFVQMDEVLKEIKS